MRAVALVSGGLDSRLAARLVKEQGVELIVLNFKTPFCLCDRTSSGGCVNEALKVARDLGVEFKVINVTDEFLDILRCPRHGYGSNMNPCIDCRILMFRKAREFMQESGCAFLVTGEVLGQRPMSQHRRALGIIEKEAGLEGLVLRPLSAKNLAETLPEKRSWVLRDRLLDLSGRSRKPQIELAKKLYLKDYPCPAGGCLLTDPEFAKRIKDLMRYSRLGLNDVELLKIGRHFRISKAAKLIVGRNEKENIRLLNLAKEDDYVFMPQDLPGATALGRGTFDAHLIELSRNIVSRYCDLNGHSTADISYGRFNDKEKKTIETAPAEESLLRALRV